MVDETIDVSNVKQVVICLRWVNEIQEEFVGLYKVASTGAEISIVLLLMQPCLVQCAVEPRAIFTHCYRQALFEFGL